jgi:hypothetical protein
MISIGSTISIPADEPKLYAKITDCSSSAINLTSIEALRFLTTILTHFQLPNLIDLIRYH